MSQPVSVTSKHHRRGTCRLCGSRKLEQVLSLIPTPPANAFVSRDELGAEQPCYPLDLHFCNACAHVQLLDVVDPGELFSNYVYVSGTSPVFVEHFEEYATNVTNRYGSVDGRLVVEIGSNDGTLLKFFRDRGAEILGIDPARQIAAQANANGVETLAGFFTPGMAREIRQEYGAAKVVAANNVLAHADDLAAIIDGVVTLLADDGVLVFEVSYLADVYQDVLFDTIYHEHLDYHSVKPLVPFLDARGLCLTRVERVASHGGSIRCYVQPKAAAPAVHASVRRCITAEEDLGLDRVGTFRQFGERITELGSRLRSELESISEAGKTIAAYGAPAKATTLMYHFQLNAAQIEFIVDDSEWKQGLYSPGLHIPVVASSEIYRQRPDCLLVLAWNFADPIISKHQAFRDAGGTFIVPLPEMRLI